MTRRHGEVDPAFAHLRDQRLGLRVLGRWIDVDLQAGVTEPLQRAPVGAARSHGHGPSGEILDSENGVVVVAGHQEVVDVIERPGHRHAGPARRRIRRQRCGGDITAPAFEHVEQRCVLRSDHHLDEQPLATCEFFQQLEFEADLLAAPQEEGRGVVARDDAQHAVVLDGGEVAVSLSARQPGELLSGEKPVELFEQIRCIRIDCPRHGIALERLGDDPQCGPVVPEPFAVADVDRRHVVTAVDHSRQHRLGRGVLRHDAHLDIRIRAACTLHDLPERGLFPNHELSSGEVVHGFDAITHPHHDVLARAMGGNGEGDLFLAGVGDRHVRGDEVPPARDQRRNEQVPVVHLDPVDVKKVLFGKAPDEHAVELRRVSGNADVGVADFRFPAGNDDGQGSSRRHQLERRAQGHRRIRLSVRLGRSADREQPCAHQHREPSGHGFGVSSQRCRSRSAHGGSLRSGSWLDRFYRIQIPDNQLVRRCVPDMNSEGAGCSVQGYPWRVRGIGRCAP